MKSVKSNSSEEGCGSCQSLTPQKSRENTLSPVTLCQKPEKLRVKREDETATIGARLVVPARALCGFTRFSFIQG